MSKLKAKHLHPGSYLYNGQHMIYVDDVEFTKDGEVLVRVGTDGTGTIFYKPDEWVYIS